MIPAAVVIITEILSTLVVPLLVAVIMGGPAWLTARAARKEGLSIAELLVTRIDDMDKKLDALGEWKIAHEAAVEAEVNATKVIDAAALIIAEEEAAEAEKRSQVRRWERRRDDEG